MSDVIIGAKVGPMDVSRAARSNGFSSTDSRAHVVRYALLRTIGYSHDEALSKSGRTPVNSDPGLKVTGESINAKIDAKLLAEIERSPVAAQFRTRSQLVRYALLRADGYPHDEAIDEAYRPIGRPCKNRELP